MDGAISRARRGELLRELEAARRETDALFALVRPEALLARPIPERHRLLFYLGHLEAFDWNLIGTGALGRASADAALDRLFAFGIDPAPGALPADAPSDWPDPEEVERYRRRARARTDASLGAHDRVGREAAELADGTLLEAAIEHRLMHAETLSYALHRLPLGDLRPPAARAAEPGVRAPLELPRAVEIAAGRATLGASRASGFGWDNEREETAVDVPAFAIEPLPVTNGRFLAFVREGGYRERGLWSEADWAWRESEGVEHPAAWRPAGGGFRLRAAFDERDLPLDWPVYVTLAEASAFARWAGARLPREAEWHRAAYGAPAGGERPYPWGEEPPSPARGRFGLRGWDPAPVGSHPAGASAWGVHDLLGNGWEWTADAFAPLPGFAPARWYPGYSADFFDGRHFVLKGGSPRTALRFLRRSFRNWFRAHYRHVWATFRLAAAAAA